MRVRLRQLIPLTFAVACGGGGGFPDAPAPPPQGQGTITVAWSIVDASGGSATCSAAGASFVHLSIAAESTGEQDSQNFSCDAESGFTGPLSVGTYDLGFLLLDSTEMTVLATGSAQMGVAVTANGTTDVGTVVFTLGS